jgi:Ni/Co efflux regulator RcnB
VKKQFISTLLVAVLAAGSSLAQAQPDRGPGGPGASGQDRGPGNGQGKGPGNGHNSPPGKGQSPGHGQGPSPQRGPDHDRGHAQGRPDPSPARWNKGERVPQPYRGPQYVVNDWRGYHLKQPPRGYQWIGVGADYFLVGVATGIVLESVFGR